MSFRMAARSASELSSRQRQQVSREVLASLEQLGLGKRDEVAGLLHLDLSSLAGERSADDVPSPLLRQHVGYLEVEPGVVRLEILTAN